MDPVFLFLLNDQGNKKNKLGCYNIVSIHIGVQKTKSWVVKTSWVPDWTQ